MADNLLELEKWMGALLDSLTATELRKLARQIGTDLRRSQIDRIKAQRNPDGSAYVPRKPQSQARAKKGAIKRKAMFRKLATTRYVKMQATAGAVTIGFTGRVARIARVHQEGLKDTVNKQGKEYQYPVRELLGFTETDRALIANLVISHLNPGT